MATKLLGNMFVYLLFSPIMEWERTFGGAKLMSNPIQVWFRDHMMPFFLKFSAKPEALDWVYGYTIDWDEPVSMPTAQKQSA
jgi:hypothetical protein